MPGRYFLILGMQLACVMVLAKGSTRQRCACGQGRRLRSLSQKETLCKAALDALQQAELRLDANQLKNKYCRSPPCNCGQRPKPREQKPYTDPMYFLNEAVVLLTPPADIKEQEPVTATVSPAPSHEAVTAELTSTATPETKQTTLHSNDIAAAATATIGQPPSTFPPQTARTTKSANGATSASNVQHPIDLQFIRKVEQLFLLTGIGMASLNSSVYDALLEYGSSRAFSLGFIPFGKRYASCFKFLSMDGSTESSEPSSDHGFLDVKAFNGDLLIAWKDVLPEEGSSISENCRLPGLNLTRNACLQQYLLGDIEKIYKNNNQTAAEAQLKEDACNYLISNINGLCLRKMIGEGRCIHEKFRFLQIHCYDSTNAGGFVVPDDKSKGRFQSGVIAEPIKVGNDHVDCIIGYGIWKDSPMQKGGVTEKLKKPDDVV